MLQFRNAFTNELVSHFSLFPTVAVTKLIVPPIYLSPNDFPLTILPKRNLPPPQDTNP